MFRRLWAFIASLFRRYVLRQKPQRARGEGYKRTREQRRAVRTMKEWRREFYLHRAVEKRVRKGIARLHHWYSMGRRPMDGCDA